MKPRAKRGRKKKRRPNAGSFKPGPDPRRHQFTREQSQKGYARAMEVAAERGWDVYAWLFREVRGYYDRKRRISNGS